jgi:hypothetical protein
MAGIRLATADDTEDILAIYAPIVRDTAISFELKPPTPAQMQERIERTLAVLPWLVADASRASPGMRTPAAIASDLPINGQSTSRCTCALMREGAASHARCTRPCSASLRIIPIARLCTILLSRIKASGL